MISTITATQVFTALSPTIRKNITELFVYRLRNYKDLETLLAVMVNGAAVMFLAVNVG